MTTLLVAVAAVAIATSVPLISRVRHEYRQDGVLSTGTVVWVWVLYPVILVVAVLAAAEGAWDLGLPRGLALGVGLPLIAFGVVLDVAGVVSMASFGRMSGIQPDRLITGGAFRYSRNPQNVGVGIALAGVGIAGSSGLALVVAAGFWAIFSSYLRHEEAHLERLFGDEYRAYRERTPRFLGLPSANA